MAEQRVKGTGYTVGEAKRIREQRRLLGLRGFEPMPNTLVSFVRDQVLKSVGLGLGDATPGDVHKAAVAFDT